MPAERAPSPGRPTINDVARLANVSKKTVSRVLNRSPFVNEETRLRIEAIIAETGYVPDPQARGLAFRRSFLIGMIYDNPNPQYVVNMQQGILDGLKGSGYELVVHPCDRRSRTYLEDVRGFVTRQKLFGVVTTPSVSEDEQLARLLEEEGCLYIRIASVALDQPNRMIVSNDRLGGVQAARHLLELGHTRIGFIAGPPSFRSTHERRGGLEDGLTERGLRLDPAFVAEGAYTFDSGLAAALVLLGRTPRPTAIFAGNDEMAAGALQAARQLGLDVPADVSIVGFDDFQLASAVWPPLTTLRAPTRDVGLLAARRLFALGAVDVDPVPEPKTIAPKLVVRDSTGPCPPIKG